MGAARIRARGGAARRGAARAPGALRVPPARRGARYSGQQSFNYFSFQTKAKKVQRFRLTPLSCITRLGSRHRRPGRDRLPGPGSKCLESLPAFLVLSSQSPIWAGGAPDGHGLGRGAAGPRGATLAARARAEIHVRTGPGDAGSTAQALGKLHCPHGTGRRRIDSTGPDSTTLTARARRRRVERPGLLRVA